MSNPGPWWRWKLWCALNWLHVSFKWRWLDRAWAATIAPDWLGGPGTNCGEGDPF